MVQDDEGEAVLAVLEQVGVVRLGDRDHDGLARILVGVVDGDDAEPRPGAARRHRGAMGRAVGGRAAVAVQ